MCGIVGYVGGQSALGVVMGGLRRLEYRGYDSAGIALVSEGKLFSEKRAGKLAVLDTAVSAHLVEVELGKLQVFSCEMATVRGYDVDQPRNLAKSVTVE